MTSLAKQLQRLAVPHTQVVLGDDKKKVSLLFDPREASNLDRDTFHALGLNGIEELINIDKTFEEFEAILFGDATLTFERSLQTKEINQKLDANVKRFLIHLSPYCLLKPAHKALEWLIQRFSIHLYNTDDLLLCFLPYHDSNVFARVLQLIKFDSKLASKWDFMQPLQKSGVPLSRLTLTNHCKTDLGFMSFVCEVIPTTVMVLIETCGKLPNYRVLFSFYATLVIGVLDAGEVREELLGLLLPHLSRGLKSEVLEYKASTYMILAQLLHKTNIKTKLLETLLHSLVKGMVPDLLEEAVACVLLMYQTQEMLDTKLKRKTFKYMCQHYNLVNILSQLSQQFDANLFISCFLERLIPAAFTHAVGMATSGETSESDTEVRSTEYIPLLYRLLSNIQLPDDTAEYAAFLFLQKYVAHGNKYLDDDVDDKIKDSLQGIVRQLEGKHSKAVDRAVNRMLTSSKDKVESGLVHEFLNLYVLSVPHQLVADSDTSLVLSLNHRLPAVRKKAVTTLLQNKDMVEDDAFLKDSLLLRLKDEDPEVVQAALSVNKEIWFVVGDDLLLIGILKIILQKGIKEKVWQKAASQVTKLLGEYSGDNQLEIINSFLPCFWSQSEKELPFRTRLINILLKSTFAGENKVLKAIFREMKKDNKPCGDDLADLNHRMAKYIAAGLAENMEMEGQEVVVLWTDLALEIADTRLASLILLVLDELISMSTDVKLRLMLCQHQLRLIATLEMKKKLNTDSCILEKLDTPWNEFLNWNTVKPYEQSLSTALCLKALNTVIKLTDVPSSLDKERVFWYLCGDESEEDLFLRVCVQLFHIMLSKIMLTQDDGYAGKKKSLPVYRDLFKLMEKHCFSDCSTYLKFLGMLWTQHANDLAADFGLTLTLQALSLNVGLAYIKSIDDPSIVLQSESFVCNLLIVLKSEHSQIRRLSVEISKELLTKLGGSGSMFKPLLTKIVKCKEEIQADSTYIYQAIAKLFKSTTLEEVKSQKKKTPRKSLDAGSGKGDNQHCLSQLFTLIVNEETPHFIQHALLEVFTLLNNKDTLNRLLPLMSRLMETHGPDQPKLAIQCLNLILRGFNTQTAECLGPNTEGLKLFLTALKQETKVDQELMSPKMVALEQVAKEMYSQLAEGSQQRLLSTLYDVGVDTPDLDISNQLHRVFKHISVDGNHIQHELKQCLKPSTAKTVREAKRQKVTKGDVDDEDITEFDSRDWQRTTIVLESIQTKKKLQNYTVLVPVCFQLLGCILDSDSHMSAEYLKQLVLALLYNICGRLEKAAADGAPGDEIVPEEQFNMELIVNCIRSSDNPQTHHQALLLLTSAAKIFPEHLVHNMMSVFTFMGQSILRQDDAYSFQIISKILETVIPALVTVCNKDKKKTPKKGSTPADSDTIITMVIQVFVDSYPYIPAHRRPLVFHKLLDVIGGESSLWKTLLLMMEMVVSKGTLKAELTSEEPDSQLHLSDMEFCLNLCAEFSPDIQLVTTTEMINYLIKLPNEKNEESAMVKQTPAKGKAEEVTLFSVAVHTDKQLRYFKYASIHLLVSLFSSATLVAQTSHHLSEEGDDSLTIRFQQLLEKLLLLVSSTTQIANRSTDKPTAKFWRALQHKSCELMDKFVSLLPDTMFIEVISGLIKSDLPSIQRRALDLLNTKLQQRGGFTESESETLLALVDELVLLIYRLLKKNLGEEVSINCQTAFISIKLLCRSIGAAYPNSFKEVLKASIDIFESTRKKKNVQICSCALLCIAECCTTLKVHVIKHLTRFLSLVVKDMKDLEKLMQNELYMLSVVTALTKIVESIPEFLSPYLKDILISVFTLCTMATEVESLQKQQVQIRLKTIRATLSNLETRVLLPIFKDCFADLVEQKKYSYIPSLVMLLDDHMGQMSREMFLHNTNDLQGFFLKCLDFRISQPQVTVDIINDVENITIDTVINFVMKLSESTFKPFLFKLFDLATSSDDNRDRVLVFYRLAEKLAERLRSLFTLFAGHLVTHIANMLESNNKEKNSSKFFPTDKKHRKKSCKLLVHVLNTVYKCCLYDTEGFVTRERFEALMQPLVDQIENTQGTEEVYSERVREHLVPCIVQLAVAAQDDSLWRTLNYQVCLTTRSQHSQVKLSALQVLDELHKKLGEDYMPLLPDSVPFLAELMEDESEEVEKKCHVVIRDMEKTLGEPLQKYF